MLNLNQCCKVEDSCSPLSCNAVKVSFQIKRGLFDLPNIVFLSLQGLEMVGLIFDQPSLPYPLLYTHIYNTNTHACSLLWTVLWSGQGSMLGCQGPNTQIAEYKKELRSTKSNHDAYQLLAHLQ